MSLILRVNDGIMFKLKKLLRMSICSIFVDTKMNHLVLADVKLTNPMQSMELQGPADSNKKKFLGKQKNYPIKMKNNN